MAWYVEGIRRIDGGHLVRSGSFVPSMKCTNPDAALQVGPYATVQGGIRHEGRVIVGRGAVTWTTVRGGAEVILGAETRIAGDVIATGRVVVQAGAKIDGRIKAGSDVRLLGECQVGDVDAGGDIVIVGAPKTGELRPQGRVRTRPW